MRDLLIDRARPRRFSKKLIVMLVVIVGGACSESDRAQDETAAAPSRGHSTTSVAATERGSGLICPRLRMLVDEVARGEVVGRHEILVRLRPISEFATETYSTVPERTTDIYLSDIEVNLATAVLLSERNDVAAFAGAIDNAKESCAAAGY